jgi:hypothetical protein
MIRKLVKRLMNMSLKEKIILLFAISLLTMGAAGLILTIQDVGDPITSGEYSISMAPPEGDPYPQVEVKTEEQGLHDPKIEKLEKLADATVEAGKELMSEVSEMLDGDDTDKTRKAINGGGLGFGTLVGAYFVYRFIFK